MRIFENLNYDFLSKRTIAYLLSSTLFLIGMISVFMRGFEFGIDFKGGTEIVLVILKMLDSREILVSERDILDGIIYSLIDF